MVEESKKQFAKVVRNLSLINYIGLEQLSYKAVSEKVLADGLVKVEPSEKPNIAAYMKNLAPLIRVEMTSGNYYVDVLELKNTLREVFGVFGEAIFENIEPEKEEAGPNEIDLLKEDINRLEENEAAFNELIKSLQNELEIKNAELKKMKDENLALQTPQIELVEEPKFTKENTKTNKINKTNITEIELSEAVKKVISMPILVSDITIFDKENHEISFESDKKKRVFDEASEEYSAENLKKKTANRLLEFIKNRPKAGDDQRKKAIEKLLKSDSNNDEKFIKYILMTPNLPRNYIKTIDGASDLGLDAATIIELLEQPDSNFNPEIFEYFVSRVHKGNGFNHKKEFAKELLKGDWYIKATVNGVEEKLQLVPYSKLESIKCELLALMEEE